MTNRAKTLFALAGVKPWCRDALCQADNTIINRSHGSQRDISRRVVGALPVQRLKA